MKTYILKLNVFPDPDLLWQTIMVIVFTYQITLHNMFRKISSSPFLLISFCQNEIIHRAGLFSHFSICLQVLARLDTRWGMDGGNVRPVCHGSGYLASVTEVGSVDCRRVCHHALPPSCESCPITKRSRDISNTL